METMMPWNGWFSRLLKDKLGDERYTALSNWAQFRPDDPHGLIGVPEHARTTTEGVPRIKGFRYPAPGSRPAVEIPTADLDSDPYNINYYSKDTRRNAKSTTFHIVGSDVTVEETKMLPNTVTMIEIEEVSSDTAEIPYGRSQMFSPTLPPYSYPFFPPSHLPNS